MQGGALQSELGIVMLQQTLGNASFFRGKEVSMETPLDLPLVLITSGSIESCGMQYIEAP